MSREAHRDSGPSMYEGPPGRRELVGSQTYVQTRDGRQLAVYERGHPDGLPVLGYHGTPGSGELPWPRSILLYRLGVRHISYSRPGYGGSTRHKDRTIADAAKDTEDVADHLKLETFSVAGRSGGALHALGTAAILGDRIDRAASLVGMAPPDTGEFALQDGMGKSNEEAYSGDGKIDEEKWRKLADLMRENPRHLPDLWWADLAPSDFRVVANIGMAQLIKAGWLDGIRDGADGWIDDLQAFITPWGADVTKITALTALIHGERDRLSPPDHSRWLAEQIPHSQLVLSPRKSHFNAMEEYVTAVGWLVGSEVNYPRNTWEKN